MKRLIIICVVAGLAWSGHWFWSAHQLRQQTEAWFEARRAAGWEARYDDLTVLGFPNRLDATFTDLTVADPAGSVRWQAPFLQVFRLIYKPEHLILVWPEDQTLTTAAGTTTVSDEGMRASLVLDEGEVLRSNLEARSLTLEMPGGVLAMTDLTAALAHIDADSYRLAFNASGPAAEDETTSGFSADATFTLDAPLTQDSLNGPPPQPTGISLRLAEYRIGEASLKLSGDLDLDAEGVASGTLSLQAENWRELLDAAGARGDLPTALVTPLDQSLTLVANLRGNPETLDLTLEVSEGRLSLGLIPVGRIPPLRLP